MAVSLRINIVEKSVTKTLQFDPSTNIQDVCKIIRDKCSELPNLGQHKDYGLFLAGELPGTGAWLEPCKTLDYYLLRNGDTIEYRKKIRTLKVRTLDGTNKTLMVDDSQNVSNLLVVICTKMGITNHDEYSLVRDLPLDELDATSPNPNYGTLTLRRKREEKERDAKMEQLRKKLKTDDDLNWVDHTKTLREQGIENDEVLTLRRKFFFSDQNIDSHDPVQLNLLYVQARDAILDSTHPVTQDKACEFAGIQCQIQFGDHNSLKHRPGLLDLKEYLPSSYLKVKGIEKKVFMNHRLHVGLSELDAKALYARKARSLPTYGVTFFLVKEKMEGKNKLVPRLLGVTKDSVLRLDERTKEIMKTWPLTTVRRWAASPNTFTLDFGDYSDQYYSVQTMEGEQIAQLIAGYIDIILRKKQAKDRYGDEGDEGSTLIEDMISPYKATIVQRQLPEKPTPLIADSVAKPAVLHAGPEAISTIQTGQLQGTQYSTIRGQLEMTHTSQSSMNQMQERECMSNTQRALRSGHESIQRSKEYLDTPLNLPPLGHDPASRKWRETTLDTKRQNVQTQIASMCSSTAHIVSLTSRDEVDSGAMCDAVSSISSSLPEVTKDIRMISALMDDSGNSLLEATRKLCNAFSDLLNAAEPGAKEPRQNLLSAAGRIGEASRSVLNTIGEGDSSQDVLLGLAKNVANSSAALVVQARKCAGSVDEAYKKEEIINCAAQTALSASELVACCKVVAPTISHPKCREELVGATRRVAQAVDGVSTTSNTHVRDKILLDDLQSASRAVTESLNRLLDHIRPQARTAVTESTQERLVDRILVATDKIMTSEDSGDMVRQTQILAEATAQLINAIKGDAEKAPDSEVQRKLIAAAKVLAEATSKLVEAAKQCASAPNTPRNQDLLRQAAQDLREATNFAAGGAVQRKILRRLESSAKNAASAAAQTIAASQTASPHCGNATTREAMSSDCRAVADTIPNLVSAVKSSFQVSDETAQSSLIEATEKFLSPSNSLVNTTKNAANFIDEPSAARHLSQCSQRLAVELVELRTSLDRIRAESGLTSSINPKRQMEAAASRVREVKEEILAFKRAAGKRELKPLPNDNPQSAIQRLTSSIRRVGTTTDQMTISIVRGDNNSAITAAQGMSAGLGDLVGASRAVAATSDDQRVLSATEEVLERSWTLLRESSTYIGGHEPPQEREGQLGPLAKGVHDALDKVQTSIPGQREVEEAINSISSASAVLDEGEPRSPSNKNYGQLQTELQHLAQEVSESSNEVCSTASHPGKLGGSSKFFSSRVTQLIHTGASLANLHEEVTIREEILLTLKNVSIVTSNFLVIAKSISANPNAPGVRNQLTSASRQVNETLNQLIDSTSSAAPGQKECDNAVRRIQALKPLIDNPNEPLNTTSYFDCTQHVVEKSKLLGDAMTGIANFVKEGRLDHFGASVNSAADAICGLIESSAQAAYLLAASEPSSVAGRPGLVDMHAINQSAANIRSACQVLSTPNVTQPAVLGAATTIAKHTSSLCTACRAASERTHDQSIKRQFVQLAKDVANSTATLVKEIKALDQDHTEKKRETCSKATNSLIKSVNSLISYASQPDFQAIPAKISPKGRAIQEPIISSGRDVIQGSCSMLQSAKTLAMDPNHPSVWQSVAQHSKLVSDSIKKMVTALREKAPGQRECELSIARLKESLRELHKAIHAADSKGLAPRKNNTIQGFIQNAENSVRMAEEHLEPLRMAGRSTAEGIGHEATSMVAIIDNLASNVIGASSNISEIKEQFNLMERTRTVLESCLQLISACKEAGGNPKASGLHQEVDLSAQCFQEGLDDLKSALERISSGAGSLVTSLSEAIASSMVKLDQGVRQSTFGAVQDQDFVTFQSRMVGSAKEIARLSQEMVSKGGHDVNALPGLSSELTRNYTQLAGDARGAIGAVLSQDVGTRLRCGVQELGRAVIDMVKFGGVVQFAPPGDAFAQRDLGEGNRVVSEKVSDILAALQAGSRGTQACINAASAVSGIIGDLDTTIMFATAGTLHSESDEAFVNHKDNILKTAKALVEDTKTLVAGAASTQEQLAVAAQNAVATIVQLSEAVKFGASSLGSNNPESQVMLINSVRDVAAALYDLIHATKNAAGKGQNDQSMITLKESAKIMVTNVTSLLKTVKAVEDEHSRGTRALEATIEAIAQEIRAFDSPEVPRGRPINPDELVRATKPVMAATSKAVSAGFSCKQDDVIVAANMGRKTISDLLTSSKSSAFAVDGELRERTLIEARKVAVGYRQLLQYVLHALEHPGEDVKDKVSACSRNIATSITDLVAVAQLMKVVNNQLVANSYFGDAMHYPYNHKGGEFVDPEDPTVIAENELLGAANSIDAAAKKLEKLRPRKSIKEADETLNFDEMILEAAKSIAAATSAIVKAASHAQRELVDSGRVSRKAPTDVDEQWSEGLVSAAQMVAAATHSLVEAANALVQGLATEEKLISSAKQVASSTAQLLVACKVKASAESDATRRLQLAGNAVKRATDNLVKAAQQALDQEEERQLILNKRMVGGIAQEINARSDVLKIERQLEEARNKLAAIRKAKYQEKTGGLIGYEEASDLEIEAVLVSEPSRLESLLESSAERINNTTNAFNIIRQSQQKSQSHYASPTPVQKPVISPKPAPRGEYGHSPGAPPPPMRSFHPGGAPQVAPPPPPPPTGHYATPGGTGVLRLGPKGYSSGATSGGESTSGGEDHYSRPIYSPQSSSTASPTVKFMKPSDFVPKTFGGGPGYHSVTSPVSQSGGQGSGQEYIHYDSGPIESERVYESSEGEGGNISLKRIFQKSSSQQQQSSFMSSSSSSSSKKVFEGQGESK